MEHHLFVRCLPSLSMLGDFQRRRRERETKTNARGGGAEAQTAREREGGRGRGRESGGERRAKVCGCHLLEVPSALLRDAVAHERLDGVVAEREAVLREQLHLHSQPPAGRGTGRQCAHGRADG